MDARDLLLDAFGRIPELYADVVDGLDTDRLHHRPEGTGNSIAWLLWHATRVQDDHIADLAGTTQAWDDGWRDQFGLELPEHDTGFGHESADVDRVRVQEPSLLIDYQAEVHARTTAYLQRVDAEELDRIVDRRWDPPVTAGVRLISIQGDCLQHLGQAAYLKGLPR